MNKAFHILVYFVFLHLLGAAYGQVQYEGEALRNDADFDASEVIYLLEPLQQEIVQGTKEMIHNSMKKALEYAVVRPVDLSPEENGQWISHGDMSVWRIHLFSPGALSIGLVFSEYELLEGVRLFVYDSDGKTIRGAYTEQNNKESNSLFVGHIPGDEVILELQVDNPDRNYGSLRLADISHAVLPVFNRKSTSETGLGTSQDCEIDVNCEEGEDWQIIKNAICQVTTPALLCTGALVNNTSYDGTPYVITAEHCINNKFYAGNTLFYFGFENSSCEQLDAPMDMSVASSTLMATGGTLDFTLVKLSRKPPRDFEAYYLGWDAREQNHIGSIALHHPNADAMKISFDYESTVTPSSVPGDINDYIVESNFRIQEWDIGTTEGGSSGCPLLNSNKHLIGTLSGGLARCGDSISYDAVNDRVIYSLVENRNDYFSKVSYNWNHFEENNKQLRHWLDPTNSGQLVLGGLSYKMVGAINPIAENRINVYPNPGRGMINIELPFYSGQDMQLRVFDLTGKLQYISSSISEYPVSIDLSKLQPGIYFLLLEDEGKRYAERIVLW